MWCDGLTEVRVMYLGAVVDGERGVFGGEDAPSGTLLHLLFLPALQTRCFRIQVALWKLRWSCCRTAPSSLDTS